MKRLTPFRWVMSCVLLIVVGFSLIHYAESQESKRLLPYQIHEKAQKAFDSAEFKSAYALYIQSSIEFEDPHLKALALCEAAAVGWTQQIADYYTLVDLYKQALRYDPDSYEASFNLELLYWLKEHSEELPKPDPGSAPTRQEDIPSGDI